MSAPDEKARSADSPTLPFGGAAPARALDVSAAVLTAIAERYDVLEELGRGGMGVVYRARDRETGDELALKVLRPELAQDEDMLERFRNELRLARKITHKNVCRMYELLRFGEHVVIAMEYVRGESLREVLRRFGALSRTTALRMAAQICGALAEAHGQGVVHRDLKPENIVVDRDGQVKVMDFGIARSLHTRESTNTAVLGTPAYMAPEQIDGKPADARTDIYALGLMLHEMMSGHAVFEGDTPMTVAMKHLKEPPRPLREVEPSVPAVVEKAVLRCLEKSPEKRFQHVAELASALAEERSEEVAGAVSAALPWRLVRWTKADWVLTGAAVLGIVVFAALFSRVLPWASLASPIPRAKAVEKAKTIFQTMAPELELREIECGYGWFWMSNHFYMRSFDRRNVESWVVEARGKGPAAAPATGQNKRTESELASVWVDLDRDSRVLSFAKRVGGLSSDPLRPEDFAAVEPFAKEAAQKLFQVELRESARKYRLDAVQNKWIYADERPQLDLAALVWRPGRASPMPYTWEVREDGVRRRITVWATKADVWSAGSRYDVEGGDWYGLGGRVYAMAGVLLLGVLFLPLMFLFFAKRLYRSTEWSLLGLAGFAALGLFVLLQADASEIAAWQGVVVSVVAVPIFYFALTVPHYYLSKTLPYAYTTTAALARNPLSEPGVGIALLRGVLLGAGFAGVHALLLLGAKLTGWAAVWTGWMEITVPTLFDLGRTDPPAGWGAVLTIPVAVLCPVLVALPVALAKRASANQATPMIATGILWLVTTAALPGTALFPAWAFYVVSAAQGALFAWILLRYDMLTLTAMFLTVETIFVVFPIYWMNRAEASWTYPAGFAPFVALLCAAVFLSQWANLRRSWERVRTVVE